MSQPAKISIAFGLSVLFGLMALPAEARYPSCSCAWCAIWPTTYCDLNISGPPETVSCMSYLQFCQGGPVPVSAETDPGVVSPGSELAVENEEPQSCWEEASAVALELPPDLTSEP